MAFIGSLITTVKANTAPFRKDMKKAGKRTKKLRKQLKGLALGGAKFGAVLGGVAVAALVAYTVKAFKAIDATKKLADELEIATADLIGYQLAAGLSGTNTETLNKALQRMARTVGEARAGITTGTKALEDFGIKIEDLQGLSTAQIFEKFSEEISKIEDPMVRAAKSALIFGKAGQKLLNFLSLGKTGLAAVKEEANKLGLAFDEVDARKVEEANDAILKLTTVAEGMGNTLAISVAPFITKIADKMGDFIKASGGIDTLVKGSLTDLSVIVGQTVDLLKLGQAAWNLFSATARVAIAAIISPLVKLDQQTRSLLKLLNKDVADKGLISLFSEQLLKDAETDIKKAEEAFKDFEEAALSRKLSGFLAEVKEESTEIANTIEKSKKSQQGLTDATKEHAKALEETVRIEKQRADEFARVLKEADRIFEETRTPLEKIEAEIIRINELFGAGGFEGIEGAFDRKIQQLEDERQAIEEALNASDQAAQDKAREEAEKIGKSFEEGILNGLGVGVDGILGDIDKAKAEGEKKTERKAGFRQIDVRNINIEGLARFGGDKGNEIDKKQLNEAEQQTDILEEIKNRLNLDKVAVAV